MYTDAKGESILAVVAIGIFIATFYFLNSYSITYHDELPKKYDSYVLSNGTTVEYTLKENGKKTELTVFNSFQFTDSERKEFLKYLKSEHPEANIKKINNEWVWHNMSYYSAYKVEKTASVNVYLDADDEGHGPLSVLINNTEWMPWNWGW